MDEFKSVLARFLLSGDTSAGQWLQAFTSSSASWDLAFSILREVASEIQQPSFSPAATGSPFTFPNKAQEHAECLFAAQVVRSKVLSASASWIPHAPIAIILFIPSAAIEFVSSACG